MVSGDSPLRPFLKWAGGKRQLVPEIIQFFPKDADGLTYYEPFVGAGAVLFGLRPQKAVINDSNEQLMTAYRTIKNDVESVIKMLKGYQKKHGTEFYYTIRNLDRDSEQFGALPDCVQAARLIYLNKTCFNGLYRVNAKGFFNVPQGRYKNPAICEEDLLRRISDYLNAGDVAILHGDFEQAVQGADSDSFVYFDPPYHTPVKTGFTGYQPDGFGEKEHERLRDLLLHLTGLGVKCLLSNADTAFVRELYCHAQFEIIPVRANRRINSNAAKRGDVGELLIRSRKD